MTAEPSRTTHPEAHFTEEESQFLVRALQMRVCAVGLLLGALTHAHCSLGRIL